ncbi:hypothetical protein WIW90_06855 [Sulfolobaceae archaeon RB850M]|jgi:hypothetical protein|nr:hypothetical protein [Sulfolobaceae archaeon]
MSVIFDVLNTIHGFFGALWVGGALLNAIVKGKGKEVGMFFLLSSTITIITGILIFSILYLIPYQGNLFIVHAVLSQNLNVRVRALLNLVGGAFGVLAFSGGIIMSKRSSLIKEVGENSVLALELKKSLERISKLVASFLIISVILMILAGSIAQSV